MKVIERATTPNGNVHCVYNKITPEQAKTAAAMIIERNQVYKMDCLLGIKEMLRGGCK